MTKVAKKELLNKLVPLQHKGGPVTLTLTSDELATIVQVIQQPSRLQSKRVAYLGTNTLQPEHSKVMTRHNDDDCYSVLEVAKMFQVTRQAVYKWIEEDKIKFYRRFPGSRDIRIPKDQFKKIEPKKHELLRRHQELFGSGKVSLTSPKDVFRNGEVKDD
ncbi:MAG: helix-turn-helix domain-containing protein [Paenibacillaceae bacterium]